MIILPNKKLCIITPPHTASRHLHNALCKPEIGGIYCIGPNPEGVSDHHYTQRCSEYYDFKRVLIVRNPLDRAIGLFLHYQWACENQPHTVEIKGLSWLQFTTAMLNDDNALSWLYRYTISRLVRNESFDLIIKYENLILDISALLGFEIDMEPAYHPPHVRDEWYTIDADAIASWSNILRWGTPDFFNYYLDQLPATNEDF